MRKDGVNKGEWAKHTRNTARGKSGMNRRVRRHHKKICRKAKKGNE